MVTSPRTGRTPDRGPNTRMAQPEEQLAHHEDSMSTDNEKSHQNRSELPELSNTTNLLTGIADPSSEGATPTLEPGIIPQIRTSLGLDREPTSTPNSDEDVSIPDGGRRAWLVVFGAFMNFSTGFGILNSWGTFQAFYATTWDDSLSNISWIGSLQPGLLFLSGAVFGPAFDKWGARKLMIPGAVLYLLSFILASFSTQYWQFLLSQGMMFGIGNALLYYPAMSAITTWFDRKRGLALGLAASGSSMGGIFWPLLTDELLRKYGLEWAHRIIAFVSVPLLVASCVLVRERKGLAGHDTHGHRTDPVERKIRAAVLQPKFLVLTLALFFIYLGFMIPFNLIPMYAVLNGIDSRVGNVLLAICYAGSFIGRIASGALADRCGRFNILSLAAAITAGLILCWIKMTSFGAMVVFAILFGLFSGGLIPLGSTCVAQITPDMGHIGLRLSVMMALCSIGTFCGGPVSGALLDISPGMDGYFAVFIFTSLTTLSGAIMLFIARLIWGAKGNMIF